MIEFNKKNIEVKTLGERLQDIREKAGVSIEEIAKVTKINKRYLLYLEENNYEALPSNVYVKGFLRSYSNFLGIEAEDVLRIYEKEKTIQTNIKKPRKQNFKKGVVRVPTIILPFKVIAGLFAGLFFAVIIWYFYSETGKFSEVPRLLVSKPVNNSTISESSTEVVGITDIGSKVIINGQAIFVSEKGEFRERVSLKEGINKLTIKSTNKFGREIERELNLSAQYKKEMLNDLKREENSFENVNGENNQNETIDNKIKLYVRAGDTPVWISIKIDGMKDYNGTMLAGAERIFEGDNEISITSGMANQTFIRKEGEEEYHLLADKVGVIRDIIFSRLR